MTEAVQGSAPDKGLLSGIEKQTPPPEAKTGDAPGTDQWFWDDGVPGTGARPQWLDSKFKSVADKARSHTELEKHLGKTDAPTEYDLGEYKEQFDLSNPYMQKFMETAKKSRLQNDGFKEFVGTLVEYEKSKAPNVDEEIKKLGEGAHQKIETVRRWASTHLSEQALQTIGKIGDRAEVINMLDEMRQITLHKMSQPPTGTDGSLPFRRETREEILKELDTPANGKKYTEDHAYRADIQRRLKQALGED